MTPKIQAIRGMEDVLPDASPLWEKLEDEARAVFRQYGYRNVRTPIVEPTALFVRGIGEVTDIVEKEMYVFEDRNGESLALRPEATAGIVRSAVEHNWLYNGPLRVWTMGPMFRYERPQKGRQRQFHQLDAEALGFEGPDVDAEQIIMLARLWKNLGLRDVELHINSIGDVADRKAHREKLIVYFEKHASVLDGDARRRLHTNPLRILDSKNPAMRSMIDGAPRLVDQLGEGARAHFDEFKALLDKAGLKPQVNPRIVRGLDYYNRTVFEWISADVGAQSTIAGGGRYDGLFAQLGGKPTPACGFAVGMERVILAMQAAKTAPAYELMFFVAHSGPSTLTAAVTYAEDLRNLGNTVLIGSGGSFKSQLKKADANGARYALIIGDEELSSGKVTVKDLRDGSQELLNREALINLRKN